MSAIAFKSGYTDSDVHSEDYTREGGGMAPMRLGTMMVQQTTTVFSVWDGDWAILEEYDGSGNRVQGYVQGYHGLVKTLVDNIYYYQDEVGSTSHIASAVGALIESYQYDVYGKPRVYDSGGVYQAGATPVAQDLFTGQRWRGELGLYDDRNRFMSPDLGRFLQPDPIGFKRDASNLYRYCGNDWANRTDPMGLQDGRGSLDYQTSLVGKETDSALDRNGGGDNHAFQSKWSGDEVKTQANVDSQHSQNMKNARAEAKDAAGIEGPNASANPAKSQANTPQKAAYSQAEDAVEKWGKDHISLDLNINTPAGGANFGVNSKGLYGNGGTGPWLSWGGEATVTVNVSFGSVPRGYGSVLKGYGNVSGALGNIYPPFFPAFRATVGHSPDGGWFFSAGGGIGPAVYGGTTYIGGGGYIHTWDH